MKKACYAKVFRINEEISGKNEASKMPVFDVDPMLYNERSLSLLSIKDLRDIGRNTGVPSPTTLSKSALIDYILKIVYGEVELPIKKALSGRPSSREFDEQGYLSKINKNIDGSLYSKPRLNSNILNLKVASPASEYVSSFSSYETRVLLNNNGKFKLKVSAYLDSDKDIEVREEIVKKYNLENFDVLEIIVSGENFKIVTINGIRVKDSFKGLQVSGEPVVSGTNKIFYMRSKEETKNNIEVIAGICEVNDVPLIVFSKNNYTGKTTECILYDMEEESSIVYKKLMRFLSESERLSSDGKDVVILLENVADISKKLSTFDTDVAYRIQEHFKEEFSKFSKLGNVCIMLSNDVSSLY